MPAPTFAIDPILTDLDVALPPAIVVIGEEDGAEAGGTTATPEPGVVRVEIPPEKVADLRFVASVRAALDRALPPHGLALLVSVGAPSEEALCTLRNGVWPVLHIQRVYRLRRGEPIQRLEVSGSIKLDGVAEHDGVVIACRRRAAAMSPDVTKEKFDAKAAGWNGHPGTPQYGHYRWMRRLLAVLGEPKAGTVTMDAGSGAGWVGIEAALRGAKLSSFDPSPEMVKFVESNAKENGLAVRARVGFCEDPPFDDDYELVLNSGVISFSPDPERFMDGIDRLVRRGGRLVIGDLNPKSRGFLRRRQQRLIVPVRELNGLTREDVIARLLARGYKIEDRRYYQLTWPIPELGHRTRSHLVGWMLLQLNRACSSLDAMSGSPFAGLFDSWIIVARKP